MADRILGSASKLPIYLRCPAAAVLPHTRVRKPEWDEAADRGHAIHRLFQLAPEGREQALATTLEEFGDKHKAELELLPVNLIAGRHTPSHFREVSFSFDTATGEAHEIDCEGRAYPDLPRSHVPGTCDVVVKGFQTLEVWDYKAGKNRVKAEGNEQLMHAALGAWKVHAPAARYALLGIQTVKRSPQDIKKPVKKASLATDIALVDKWELEDFGEKLRERAREAEEARHVMKSGGIPTVRPGQHCLFCPAKPSCPVKGNYQSV